MDLEVFSPDPAAPSLAIPSHHGLDVRNPSSAFPLVGGSSRKVEWITGNYHLGQPCNEWTNIISANVIICRHSYPW